MSDQEDAAFEMTADDRQARRLADLVVGFSNTSVALSSEEVHRQYYSDLSEDSFRRAFQRDRERLVTCGFTIRAAGSRDGAGLWEIDDLASFASTTELEREDALLIELACAPLVNNPEFPLRNELRLALAKLGRGLSALVLPERCQDTKDDQLGMLLNAYSKRHLVDVGYRNAQGAERNRTLALFGCFGLRGHSYFVGPEVKGSGKIEGEAKVWRADRFSKVRDVGKAYAIPEDFHLPDYIRLPFQIGEELLEGCFLIPEDVDLQDMTQIYRHGSMERGADGAIWTVLVRDTEAAAAWAIATGVVPLSPSSLVASWRDLLCKAAKDER